MIEQAETAEAREIEPASPHAREAATWIARGIIVAVAVGLAWYTWGHWGDFQIDCGRELYVPAAILQGKLLFRDIWYQYGPLAPYLQASLFWIFGVHLTVLYVFGLALTIGTALVTFEIAKQFKLGRVGSLVPSLFFLVEAFYPFIRNFVFPYSYAASVGAFVGAACLHFVIRHAVSMRRFHLVLAALLASLAILAKQEFGVACLAILGFEIAAVTLIRRSPRELWRDITACFAGLAPALAVYGWFAWKVSVRGLFSDNWISMPGTYFMRTFGKTLMAGQGLRFVPAELLEVTEYTILALAIWYVLASSNALAIERLRLTSRRWMALSLMLSLLPLGLTCLAFLRRAPWGVVVETRLFARSLFESTATRLVFTSLTEVIFPSGIFLLVLVYLLHAVWKFWKGPERSSAIPGIALGTYAALVALRPMMDLEPTLYKCPVFFNVPAFLVFIIVIDRVIRWAARSLDTERRDFLAASMLGAETVFLFVLFFPKPGILPARLTTDYGMFYTYHDVALLFPQIISFMKTHTRNGKDILVIPEPPSLYVFAGMQSPTRWHQLMPGVVPPDREQEYINELGSNEVRYVLIANRSVAEYGAAPFIEDGYNHGIYRWIMANYRKAGQFGPLLQKSTPSRAFTMWIYEKRAVDASSDN